MRSGKLATIVALSFIYTLSALGAPFKQPQSVKNSSVDYFLSNIDLIKRTKKIEANFKDVSIEDLTYLVSELLGKNIIIPDKMRGTVTLVLSKPISIKDFWNIYTAILKSRGYAILDRGDFYEIVPESKARGETPSLKKNLKPEDTLITYVYTFKNGDVTNVEKVLGKLRSKRGHLLFYKPTNMVIITDTSANIKNFKEILSLIDEAEKGITVRVYHLNYVKASEVASALKTIYNSLIKRGVHFVVYSIPSENALLVSARKDLFSEIEGIIERLDKQTSEEKEKNFYVIYLKNSKAKDLANLLSKLVRNIVLYSSPSPTKGKKVTSITSKSKIEIVPDESINALIVYGTKREYEAVKNLVSQLDKSRKQVLVSVFITEVSEKALKEIGVRWQAFSKNGGVAFKGGLSDIDFFNAASSTNFAAGVLSSSGQNLNIGGTNVFFPNLLMLFSLLQSGTGFNVISAPKLLTINNQEAKINVSQVTPFAKSVKFDVNGNPIINYDYKEVGLILKIVPHISVDKSIVMETHLEVNDVIGYEKPDIGGIQYVVPITSKRELDTTIKIPNGKTIVLGGLISKKTLKTMSGVPLLSSIPIVGNLFKYNSENKEKTNLFIFMTPYVVETPDEIAKITEWHQKLSKIFLKRKLKGKNSTETQTKKKIEELFEEE